MVRLIDGYILLWHQGPTPLAFGGERLKVLIVGLGSIGKRYADILLEMGHEVYGDDVVNGRIPEKVIEYRGSIQEELEAVFICTPPSNHMLQALKWYDKHLFIEKPLATSIEDVEDVEKDLDRNKVNMVSCQMRYDYLIKMAYGHLFVKETIGKLLCVKTDFGYYLPYWRPGRGVKVDELPGVVLDCIHEIDLLIWMHGNPVEGSIKAQVDLDKLLNTVSRVDAFMRFGDQNEPLMANIHMDYHRRRKKRVIEWVGSKGTITYTASRSLRHPSEVNFLSINEQHYFDRFSHSDPYRAQVEGFFKAIEYKTTSPNPIDKAKDVLRVALEIQGG